MSGREDRANELLKNLLEKRDRLKEIKDLLSGEDSNIRILTGRAFYIGHYPCHEIIDKFSKGDFSDLLVINEDIPFYIDRLIDAGIFSEAFSITAVSDIMISTVNRLDSFVISINGKPESLKDVSDLYRLGIPTTFTIEDFRAEVLKVYNIKDYEAIKFAEAEILYPEEEIKYLYAVENPFEAIRRTIKEGNYRVQAKYRYLLLNISYVKEQGSEKVGYSEFDTYLINERGREYCLVERI